MYLYVERYACDAREKIRGHSCLERILRRYHLRPRQVPKYLPRVRDVAESARRGGRVDAQSALYRRLGVILCKRERDDVEVAELRRIRRLTRARVRPREKDPSFRPIRADLEYAHISPAASRPYRKYPCALLLHYPTYGGTKYWKTASRNPRTCHRRSVSRALRRCPRHTGGPPSWAIRHG